MGEKLVGEECMGERRPSGENYMVELSSVKSIWVKDGG